MEFIHFFCCWDAGRWGRCPLSLSVGMTHSGFSGGSEGEELACNAGDQDWIPGSGRSLAEGNSNALQYSRLENSMDRGAWWATLYGVAKSQTWLSNTDTHSPGWWLEAFLHHAQIFIACCLFIWELGRKVHWQSPFIETSNPSEHVPYGDASWRMCGLISHVCMCSKSL